MSEAVNGIGNGHQKQATKTVQNNEDALKLLKSSVVKAVIIHLTDHHRNKEKLKTFTVVPSSLILVLSRTSTWTMFTSTLQIQRLPGAICLGKTKICFPFGKILFLHQMDGAICLGKI